MDLQLTGKHVLITGGSRGIGLACARDFLREGCRVSLVGRSEANMDQAARCNWAARGRSRASAPTSPMRPRRWQRRRRGRSRRADRSTCW
jgi:NAD(P)-dependent dehydrogenase (short-subunit alcohol dehydrogenase family)